MGKKKYTEEEALKIVFERLKPSQMPKEDYEKFRSYRNRYNKGELKKDAIFKLLEYFGFISNNQFSYDKERDQSNT